jgi:ABC-2 type transport system permease protein
MSTAAFAALSTATFKEWRRDKVGLFFNFLFPLLFLVIFGLLFHGEQYDGKSYVDIIGPGVMSWAVANGAVFGVAYWLVGWRRSDLLRLIRMTPTRVSSVLSSRYLVCLGSGVIQAAFFLGFAALPFLGLHLTVRSLLVVVPLIAGITAFAALGLLVGTYAPSPDAGAAIANSIVLPMAFLSGVFYPVEGMPGWLQNVSQALPMRHLIEGVSAAVAGESLGQVLISSSVLIGFAAFFAVFAGRLFRWSNKD